MAERGHEPVMVDEVVRFLGGATTVIDATLGAGGHAEALLDAGVERLIGVDRDPRRSRSPARVWNGSASVSPPCGPGSQQLPAESRVDGVLYDLGVSSMQLDRPERGSPTARTGRSTCGWAPTASGRWTS